MVCNRRKAFCTWILVLMGAGAYAAVPASFPSLLIGAGLGLVASPEVGRQPARPRAPRVAGKPQVVVQIEGPGEVQMGQGITYTLTVTNRGRRPIAGAVLRSTIPSGLIPKDGAKDEPLCWPLGALEAGCSRKISYEVATPVGGIFESEAILCSSTGRRLAQACVKTKVIGPDLRMTIEAPSVAFIKRPLTFRLLISNAGTAKAGALELTSALPAGLDYVESIPKGTYSPGRGKGPAGLAWSLGDLEASNKAELVVTLRTREIGRCSFAVKLLYRNQGSQASVSMDASAACRVMGVPAMHISTYDTEDPVMLGGQTTYVVEIRNEGTGPCTNVRVRSLLPEVMAFVEARGPVPSVHKGGQTIFEGVPILMPGEKLSFRITCRAVREGSALHRATLEYDQFDGPITGEEGTTCVR